MEEEESNKTAARAKSTNLWRDQMPKVLMEAVSENSVG